MLRIPAIVATLSALMLASLPVGAQQRDPNEVVTRHTSTVEGRPILIRHYASWRPDCTSRGEPIVTVDPQPQHGTVSIRPGTSAVREYIGKISKCVGQRVLGTSVWYQPAARFCGSDQFGLTINTTRVVFRDQVLVNVWCSRPVSSLPTVTVLDFA